MAISIRNSLASLQLTRFLGETTSNLRQASDRLSSGLRINRAKDDAAGLAIASSLNADARVFNQGVRNVNDGISYLNVADGAAAELSSILVRMRELATQASNGVYSNSQVSALHSEAIALQNEYNRIVASTTFNGVNVFSDQVNGTTSRSITVQAGYSSLNTLTALTELEEVEVLGNGVFAAENVMTTAGIPRGIAAGDFNGDGKMDFAASVSAGVDNLSIYFGNGDGTFLEARTYFAPQSSSVQSVDINGDGNLDLITISTGLGASFVTLGNGNGTFKAPVSHSYGFGVTVMRGLRVFDANGDGKLDLLSADQTAGHFILQLGNGNGTFTTGVTFAGAGQGMAVADVDADGDIDIVGFTGAQLLLSNGNGTFLAPQGLTGGANSTGGEFADINGDGKLDLVVGGVVSVRVHLGCGNGVFQASTNVATGGNYATARTADLNSDGYLDIVASDDTNNRAIILHGNGNGTFKAALSFAGGGTFADQLLLADMNGDGVKDMLRTANDNESTLGVSITQTGTRRSYTGIHQISGISLTSREDALAAQSTIDEFSTELNRIRGVIGSSMSRFETAVSNLRTGGAEFKAAESRIADADVAEEAARLVKLRIQQNLTAALLAQTNQQPAIALRLLKGN